jgi:hypothetical protein
MNLRGNGAMKEDRELAAKNAKFTKGESDL